MVHTYNGPTLEQRRQEVARWQRELNRGIRENKPRVTKQARFKLGCAEGMLAIAEGEKLNPKPWNGSTGHSLPGLS